MIYIIKIIIRGYCSECEASSERLAGDSKGGHTAGIMLSMLA